MYFNSQFVYFCRLWSQINFLKCSVCDMVFPLADYKGCLFHRDEAKLLKHENDESATIFPCCGQPVKVFESIKSSSGCDYREHLIDETYMTNVKDRDDANTVLVNIISELNEMKDIICTKKIVDLTDQNSLYSLDNALKSRLTPDTVPHQIISKDERKRTAHHKSSVSHKHSIGRKATRKQKLSDDEDSGSEEPGIVRIYIQQKGNKNSRKTWNSDLPFRLNQDMQREHDLIRMDELMQQLAIPLMKSETSVRPNPSCGTFHKLEMKKKLVIANTSTHQLSNAPNATRKTKH